MCYRFLSLWLLIFAFLFSSTAAFSDQQLPTSPFIFGYCNELSYAPGDRIELHLSSSNAEGAVTVRRVGRESPVVYQGKLEGLSAEVIPDRASSEGCNWPVKHSLDVGTDWKSGYYEVSLSSGTADRVATSTTFFIVRRGSASNATILLQLSTNTYNAYTNWGGHSLYAYHDRDGVQGHRVSFNRPLTTQFYSWEHPFVVWLEDNGIEVDYAANSDLEFRPEILKAYKLVLSIGHDEYWSSPMRDQLEAYIGEGGNVAFFSGNTCCWQVRSEESGRALTCWKQWYNVDPLFRSDQEHLLSSLWSHHRVKRPENRLTGVGFLWGGYHRSHGQFMDGSGAYTVHRPEHWLLAGTDLEQGSEFGGKDTIVGYECDGCEMVWRDGRPYPTHRDGTPESFEIVASSPAKWAPDDCYWYEDFPKDRVGAAVLGTYTRGGTVVTVGATDWAHGLAGKDAAVMRITKNIIDRLD